MSSPDSTTASAGASTTDVSKEKEIRVTPGPDDSTSSTLNDVVLVVEGRQLPTSKDMLCRTSPVFRKMFEGDFKDKTEVPLADKKYADIDAFLGCIDPSTWKPVQRETLDVLLTLADEYEVESLKQRCEEFVLTRFDHKDEQQSNPANEELVHFSYLAEKYKLKTLLDECVDKLKYRTYDGVKDLPDFKCLSSDTKLRLRSERLELMEGLVADILDGTNQNTWKQLLQKIVNRKCKGCSGTSQSHGINCPHKCTEELYKQWEKIDQLKKLFISDSRFK